MQQIPFKNVFVLGKARCGSTLLARMLNMHSRILSVGEMMLMGLSLSKGRPCSCGKDLTECDFWSKHIPLIKKRSGLNPRRYSPGLYQELAGLSGKDIVLDISKTHVWRSLAWPPNYRWIGRNDTGFVFLIRDSRGVLASAARRGKDFDKLVKSHFKWMKRFYRFVTKHKEASLIMHYEDLCRNPEHELRRVCAFLGIDFEPHCLETVEQPHHLIHCSTSDYLKGQNRVQQDERWKTELSSAQVDRIQKEMAKIGFLQGYL